MEQSPKITVPGNQNESLESTSNETSSSSSSSMIVKTLQIPPLNPPQPSPTLPNDPRTSEDSSHSVFPTTASGTVTPTGNHNANSTNGRIKAPPICRIPSLKKEHMTSDQMSKWCFSKEDVSSKDWDVFQTNREKILNRNESRNGRETQRFATDKQTGQLLRLTTGCVPIMSDGKILLVSSSRKGEWILPKGGWESDESMEFSALRETYEEGGVLGVIGPRLGGIEFETRKAKKRRLELESLKKKSLSFDTHKAIQQLQLQQQLQQQQQIEENTPSTVSIQSNASSAQEQSEDDQLQTNSRSQSRESSNLESQSQEGKLSLSSPSNSSDCVATKIRKILTSTDENNDRNDDAASIASSEVSSSCTHVRLCMLPVYVLEVREQWPESGRARKVVDIDTAIDAMASRVEFQQVLLEVKEKGYHLKPYHRQTLLTNVQNKDLERESSLR